MSVFLYYLYKVVILVYFKDTINKFFYHEINKRPLPSNIDKCLIKLKNKLNNNKYYKYATVFYFNKTKNDKFISKFVTTYHLYKILYLNEEHIISGFIYLQGLITGFLIVVFAYILKGIEHFTVEDKIIVFLFLLFQWIYLNISLQQKYKNINLDVLVNDIFIYDASWIDNFLFNNSQKTIKDMNIGLGKQPSNNVISGLAIIIYVISVIIAQVGLSILMYSPVSNID